MKNFDPYDHYAACWVTLNMGDGDLVRYRKIGSNTIIKGNIEECVSIMPILPEIVTFVKFSGENSERMINKKILIANALWEII